MKSRVWKLMKTVGSTIITATQESLCKFSSQGDEESLAALKLVAGLDELKGVAMKLGQILSMMDEDSLPPSWRKVLERLQSQATPWPWEVIERIIVKALGSLDVFAWIDPEACHAASMGQVHKGKLKDTLLDVAIKVQYPDLEKYIQGDIQGMKTFFSLSTLFSSRAHFDEFCSVAEKIFLQELDYLQEAKFCMKYREFLRDFSDYVVPEVILSHSVQNVLTLEWLQGKTLFRWLQEDKPTKEMRNLVAKSLLFLCFLEIFCFRHIQSDPNPGNFLVQEDGKIALLDFGATLALSPVFVELYQELLLSLFEENKKRALDLATELRFIPQDATKECCEIFWNMLCIAWTPFKEECFSWEGCKLVKSLRNEGLRFLKASGLHAPPGVVMFINRRLLGMQIMLERLGGAIAARECLLRAWDLQKNFMAPKKELAL